jgi:Carboxypeptidase regulatory-like domain/TonB-dependent Receptor Plug Domain
VLLNLRRILYCALLPISFAIAQDRGTVTGTVTDTSGAAVPGATLVLTNPATGLSQTATSAGNGNYSFIYLPAGKYNLTAEKTGFRKAEASDVLVEVNTDTRMDIKLQVGTLTESVQVTSVAPLLQTDRSDLGKVIPNKAIQDLPLFANGGLRSNVAFSSLSPGVIFNLTGDPDTTGANIRIAGGLSNGASLLLDGGESMSERRNDPQMRVVSAEGIEEFKVQTSAYSAEYGRSSNGILNYATKSGTNDFHGSAFAVIRNQALNANGFFYAPSPHTTHNQNLEAASVGGPVWIPKLFNGRNKAFFFFSGERSRAKDISPAGLISLPIQDFRNGDFRKYVGSNGAMIPIYDPFDASGNIIADASQRPRLQCNGVLNVLCPSRINPVAALIQKYFPQPANPNQVFNNNPIENNGTRTPGENQGVYAIKGDYNATEKLRFSGMFSRQYFNSYELDGPTPGPLGEGFQEFGTTKYVRFSTDYVIRANLLNHFNFGYNQRDLGEQGNTRLGPVDGEFGKATAVPGNLSYGKSANYTEYQTQNFQNINGNVSTKSPSRTYDIKEGMTWLHGRHSMKFGFEYIRVNYARSDCNGCGVMCLLMLRRREIRRSAAPPALTMLPSYWAWPAAAASTTTPTLTISIPTMPGIFRMTSSSIVS